MHREDDRNRRGRRWLPRILIGVAIFALVMMGISTLMLSQWTDFRTATAFDADRAFSSAVELAVAGDGAATAQPYLEITEDGTVHVHRELEGPEPVTLLGLHVLAWEPDHGRLLSVRFPWWFVRLKMSSAFNLGTITSAMAHDWGNLDLRVTDEDMERLGPGVVLDHRTADGARILLWTE